MSGAKQIRGNTVQYISVIKTSSKISSKVIEIQGKLHVTTVHKSRSNPSASHSKKIYFGELNSHKITNCRNGRRMSSPKMRLHFTYVFQIKYHQHVRQVSGCFFTNFIKSSAKLSEIFRN